MITTYLGIDPGKTIGYAKVSFEGSSLVEVLVSQERRDDWSTFESYPLGLVSSCMVLVIEDFVGAGHRSKESNLVLKMIGAFELTAKQEGLEYVLQPPVVRKKYLKLAEDLYRQEFGREVCNHGKDAFAHVLKAIAAREKFSPREWLKT